MQTLKSSSFGGFRTWWRITIPLLSLFLSLSLPWISVLLSLCLFNYTILWSLQRGAKLLRRLFLLIGFVILGVLPIAIVRSNNNDTIVELWNWGISLHSLYEAVQLALRCLSSAGSVLLLLALTPFYELCRRARSVGVPLLLLELIELTYRYIYVLEETTEQIATAQVARLGYQGFSSKLRHLSMLISQTFVLAQHEAESIYEGLISRGYQEDDISDNAINQTKHSMKQQETIVYLDKIGYEWETGVPVLRDIHLKINRGERIVLLGANGAGKSTLMNLIAGIRPPSIGSYYLAGCLIRSTSRDIRKVRRSVALVFQNSNHQLFCPTVFDELAFGLRNLGLSEELVTTKVEKLITRYELENLRDKAPHELSEGQKKWVSIISILALEPEIILLDEPTASLDNYYAERVIELLRELNRQGITILLSTHDMELAYEFGERAVVISSGHILADETVEVVFRNTELIKKARLRMPYQLISHSRSSPKELSITPSSGYSIPIFLSAKTTQVLIVGGGRGAYRKLQGLLNHGVNVEILSPEVVPEIVKLSEQALCTWHQKEFDEIHDISDKYNIVVAATGNHDLDNKICIIANNKGVLFANMSNANLGNFHFAWNQNKSGISLAIHTDYALPEVARELGVRLLNSVPSNLAIELNLLSSIRKELIKAKEENSNQVADLEANYQTLLTSLIDRIS